MNNPVRAKILVVDDAPLIRGMLVQVLSKYGYEVDTAEDGQQAIDYFMDHHPDLILMDADMPVLDGVAACARIRQLPDAKYLPIIIVTSFVEREWVDRAYLAGATDYVTKPVNWDVLRNRIHYILQAKHAEEALFDEKEKAQVTLASIGDGVITTDAQGRVEYMNAVACRLTGWRNKDAEGLPLSHVFSVLDENSQRPITFPIHRCLEEGKVVELLCNTVLVRHDDHQRFAIEDSAAPIRDRNGYIIGVVLVFHDVTENRKMTQELSYQAKHDALTGLYNLHEFKARLDSLLESQNTILQQGTHALVYMDLDQFKIVNDTCGHEAGDQLLKDVALLLQRRVESSTGFRRATLARLGGDEFGLLLEYCELDAALIVANQLRQEIESFRFFWSDGRQEKGIFTIGISLGLVLITSCSVNRKNLLAMADAACYAAKNAGRNNVHVYQENDAELLERHKEIKWLTLINDNLERQHGFELFYQPIRPLRSESKGFHCEIFLRMDDQNGNLLPPGAFLSAAARYNLMPTLDRWVLQNVLEWLEKTPELIDHVYLLSINVSGYSLGDKNFQASIIERLKKSPVSARKLCFEITETTAITNLTGALSFITALKKLGCQFALDDFGSGMSSFAYLKNLPVDYLKIDGDLIRGIQKDDIDFAMVKAINDIGHLMSLRTIAESVENEEILQRLQEVNVDYVQGYGIERPHPLREFVLPK